MSRHGSVSARVSLDSGKSLNTVGLESGQGGAPAAVSKAEIISDLGTDGVYARAIGSKAAVAFRARVQVEKPPTASRRSR